MKISKTKLALITMGIIGATGLGVASAVNLGISANNELAAGTSVTATCQPAGVSNDIDVAFSAPVYVPATQTFSVNQVILGNVAAACNTKNYDLVVANAAGASIGTATGVVSGTSVTVTLPAAVDAALVASVSLVIR